MSHEHNTQVIFKISLGTTHYTRLFVNMDVSCTTSEFQHGLRPEYSCQTQLIDFIENIQHAMDQQK